LSVLRALLFLVVFLAVCPMPARASRPECEGLAAHLASTRSARQLVTVVAPSAASTTAELSLWVRSGSGCWTRMAGPWQARVGRNGLSAHHEEGDGTTPMGAFGIGPTMYGIAPDPGVRYPYHLLVCGDWWDEDPRSTDYNRFVHLQCGAKPAFGGDSEPLWLVTTAYRHFAVIAYNAHPIVPGRGSAIFFATGTGAPTDGCVSLPSNELDVVLRALQPDLAPLFVIGTASTIRSE
jgi:L,D-peptidoglycan transpeptidase YkuD (ErfK/YbiS/YcfS/YnhG family)